MDDDPIKIAAVVRISRKTLRIVMQNIVFALGVKLIVLAMGAFGVANMWACRCGNRYGKHGIGRSYRGG